MNSLRYCHNVSRFASDGLELFLLVRVRVFVSYIYGSFYVFNDGTGLFVVVVNDNTTGTMMTMLRKYKHELTLSLKHGNSDCGATIHFRYLFETKIRFFFFRCKFFSTLLHTFVYIKRFTW